MSLKTPSNPNKIVYKNVLKKIFVSIQVAELLWKENKTIYNTLNKLRKIYQTYFIYFSQTKIYLATTKFYHKILLSTILQRNTCLKSAANKKCLEK